MWVDTAARAVRSALLLIAISALCFFMARLTPGSFFDDLALNPSISAGTIAALKSRYGVDQPLLTCYLQWAASAMRGDFGISIAYQKPASEVVWRPALATLKLTAAALAVTWLLAIPLAIACAAKPDSPIDRLCGALSSTLLVIPELLACLGLLYGSFRLRLLPQVGSIVLPLIVLVITAFPAVYRHARSALGEASTASFTHAARAHGIRGRRLGLIYIIPAAANPLISLLGLSIGGLASASLVAEAVLSRPGLGPLFLDSITSRDIDVVNAIVVLSACFLLWGNLMADILLYWCDPRIRSKA